AGEFRHLIANQAFWDLMPRWHLGMSRPLAEKALKAFSNPTSDELRMAVQRTNPLLAFFSFRSGRLHEFGPWLSQRVFWRARDWVSACFLWLLPSDFLWILLTGEPLILRLFGIASVTRAGLRASRLRV